MIAGAMWRFTAKGPRTAKKYRGRSSTEDRTKFGPLSICLPHFAIHQLPAEAQSKLAQAAPRDQHLGCSHRSCQERPVILQQYGSKEVSRRIDTLKLLFGSELICDRN